MIENNTALNATILSEVVNIASGNLYQSSSHSLSMMMHNTVQMQYQRDILSQAIVTQAIRKILSSEVADITNATGSQPKSSPSKTTSN